MFCSECGNKLKDGQKFCTNCGISTNMNTVEPKEIKSANNLQPTRGASSSVSSSKENPIATFILSLIIISFLFVFGYLFFRDNNIEVFKSTKTGKALLTCVSSNGKLDIKENNSYVEIKLTKKNKEIILQFEVDPSIKQTKLVGAEVVGEKNLTKFGLIINLETVCGRAVSNEIFSDEYNAFRSLWNH